MKAVLKKITESNLALLLAIVLIGLGFFYLRNGREYFTGNSGGAYWDHMNYCKTHRDSQMKIYNQLVSYHEILTHRNYCINHLDENITIDGTAIACDSFLGKEDDHSPWDAY